MTGQSLQTSNDGLENIVTGMGTSRDKRSHDTWVFDLINSFHELDAAYQTNWIARQIVDVPARDMTREWRTIKCDKAEEIATHEKELDIANQVQDAVSWARLFGGAGILLLTDQDLTRPLRVKQIKRGSLKRVLVFDRWELTAQTLNTWDVLAPNYLQPEFYTLQGGHTSIHWTHVVRFMGEKLPRRHWAQTNGWGDSVLRKCIEDVQDTVAAKNGIASLMREANIDTLTREGLAEELASDQDDAIIKRYATFAAMKSIVNMALLDGDEKLERQTLNLSGVAPIIETFITWISGAARIPVTKLFGTSAKGMNATGEGDLKNYYDDIRAMQKSSLTTPMLVLDEVMVRSAVGDVPENYDYEWNPLAQQNEVESEQARLLRAQRDQVYLDSNIVQPSQVMRELQAGEQYQFDDGVIEQLEAAEDPLLFAGENDLDPTDENDFKLPRIHRSREKGQQSHQRGFGRLNDQGLVNSSNVRVNPTQETAKAIAAHLAKIGITEAIDAGKLHVTLMHSSTSPVNTDAQPDRMHKAYVNYGGYSVMGKLGALVVKLHSEDLHERFNELRQAGGAPDYPDYIPHLSLKYGATAEDLQKIIDNPLELNEIVLSGEVMEAVDDHKDG